MMKSLQFFLFFLFLNDKNRAEKPPPLAPKKYGTTPPGFPYSNSPNVTGRTYLLLSQHFMPTGSRFSFQGVFFTIKTYSSYIQCCFWRSSRKVQKNSLDTKCPPVFWVMTSFISFLLGGVESFNVNNKNYWNHHLVYKDWLPHMIL